ncbi:hypothetical protein ALQ78_101571 [Pseudomonas syringae pv. aptata]|nr:hypothetical protein ALQ78_101571 [Pseudomonas syringae pv. aptata]
MVDQHHLAPASGSGERTHQTGSAGANDYNVSNGHSVVPRSSGHDRSHAPRQAMHKPVFDSGRRPWERTCSRKGRYVLRRFIV